MTILDTTAVNYLKLLLNVLRIKGVCKVVPLKGSFGT